MSKTQRLSINCSKKIVSVVCIFGLTFSVTGCFLLGKVKSHKNYEAMLASVAEGNLVEERTGDIPEGMEVQYALTKKQSVGESDHLYEFLYEYDDQGRNLSVLECILL